jgi:hypothetical protein
MAEAVVYRLVPEGGVMFTDVGTTGGRQCLPDQRRRSGRRLR